MSGVGTNGLGVGADPTGAGSAEDSRQPPAEVILPPHRNYFKIKTRNILKTLEKVFDDDDVDIVAIKIPPYWGYVYMHKEDFQALMRGEEVTLTITTGPPFNKFGITEAWTSGTFSRRFFTQVVR
ncbi:MAG: hypothetical protein QXH97_00180 [Candidatus Bathyarchaeia archaeon]